MSAGSELVSWLQENLPLGWIDAIDQDDETGFNAARVKLDDAEFLRAIGAAGWAQPAWAPEYGGRGLEGDDVREVEEIKTHYRVPRSFNLLGFGLAAPTIMRWATEEQKRFFLNGMAQGEWWCQLFSEPGNGSDVAGLSTRAIRDGDEWIVNGQKVWTSGAQMADRGMLIARTNPDQPKHKGITYFVVDMHAPGVDVRPLRQMTGDAEFNEVFLSEVRIPDSWRIGPEGEGWAVAQTTLMNERVALSGAFGGGGAGGRGRGGAAGGRAAMRTNALSGLLAQARADGNRSLQDRLARLVVEGRAAGYSGQRSAARRQTGQPPGPEGSIGKLFSTEYNQRLQNAIVDAAGMSGIAWETDDREAAFRSRTFLRSRGNTIEGGTSEIQRNILGDRVLGLPREPDPSREPPWKDVPRN
jgi:alkylation response protein AidB-like acyl-CoA dehydrogenase